MNSLPNDKAVALIIGASVLAFSLTDLVRAQTSPGESVDQQQAGDAQALEAGPVHEAFAEPVSRNIEQGIRVSKEPPQPLKEIPPDYRPEGDNVEWIPGYWMWLEENNDFVWISGVWRAVPPGRFWTPGHWVENGDGWRWVSGFWSDLEAEEIAYLPYPPETLDVGPSSPAPNDDHFWIPGSWRWQDDSYLWRPGYWYPGQSNWMWVPDRYTYTPRGAVFVNGYWDYPVQRRGLLYAPVYWPTGNPYQAGYAFTPNRIVNTALLLSALFIDGNVGQYYYGWGYGGRNAFLPWYSPYGRDFYSPLYGYYSWQLGRDSNNWKDQFARPGRRGSRTGGSIEDADSSQQRSMVGTVEDLQRSFREDGLQGRNANALRQITQADREAAQNRAQKTEKLRSARAEFESQQRTNVKARVEQSSGDETKGRAQARATIPGDFQPSTYNLRSAAGVEESRRQARRGNQQVQQIIDNQPQQQRRAVNTESRQPPRTPESVQNQKSDRGGSNSARGRAEGAGQNSGKAKSAKPKGSQGKQSGGKGKKN